MRSRILEKVEAARQTRCGVRLCTQAATTVGSASSLLISAASTRGVAGDVAVGAVIGVGVYVEAGIVGFGLWAGSTAPFGKTEEIAPAL